MSDRRSRGETLLAALSAGAHDRSEARAADLFEGVRDVVQSTVARRFRTLDAAALDDITQDLCERLLLPHGFRGTTPGEAVRFVETAAVRRALDALVPTTVEPDPSDASSDRRDREEARALLGQLETLRVKVLLLVAEHAPRRYTRIDALLTQRLYGAVDDQARPNDARGYKAVSVGRQYLVEFLDAHPSWLAEDEHELLAALLGDPGEPPAMSDGADAVRLSGGAE